MRITVVALGKIGLPLAVQFAGKGHDVDGGRLRANSQSYSHINRPGTAVGGHCIPTYPRLYQWTDPDATVVPAARVAVGQAAVSA